MVINLYSLNKRENSTLRPSGSGTAFNGVLRDGCDIMSPIVGFSIGKSAAPTAYNYAYIPEFARYYFISSWSWDRGIWYAHMTDDVLASWRDSIGGSTQYVLRSSAASDGSIVDSYYPMTANHSTSFVGLQEPWFGTTNPLTGGSYVVGIINKDSSTLGAVAYYAFSNSEFRALMSYLLSTTEWTGMEFDGGEDEPTTGTGTGTSATASGDVPLSADGISEPLYKSLFNPFQYVVSAMWFPFAVAGSAVGSIDFGWWTVPISGRRLSATYSRIYGQNIDIPKHPQAATRGEYLNLAPFTKLSFFSPVFGQFDLNTPLYTSATSATITMDCDYITGEAILRIGPLGTDLDVTARATLGVPIQLAQVRIDYVNAANNATNGIAGTVGNALAGNVVGAIASAITGITSTGDALIPTVSMTGSNGAFVNFGFSAFIQADFWTVVPEDNADLGRPLCQARQLSAIPGYQLILHPDITITGTGDEQRKIREYLAAGYFFE